MVAEAVKCFLTLDLDIIFLGVQIQSVLNFFAMVMCLISQSHESYSRCYKHLSLHHMVSTCLYHFSPLFFFLHKVKPHIVCVYGFHPTGWGPQSRSRSETPEKSG